MCSSDLRHEIEADIEPFRSILLGLFFMAVGMLLDLGAIIANPVFVFGMAAVVIVVKLGIIASLARWFGTPWRKAFGLGLLLSQGGEFGFVLFKQAQEALLIDPEAASLFGAIVTISMAATPFLLMAAARYEDGQQAEGDLPDGPELAPRANAIVVGFGRFGQAVSQILMGYGVSVTMIDIKPGQIETSGTYGAKVWYGDGRRVDLLRKAGADEAQLILFCLDDKDFAPRDLEAIQHSFPDAALFIRAYDRRQLIKFNDLGEGRVIREVYESAVRMGIEALAVLGASGDDIAGVEADFRHRDARRLAAQIDTGDFHALKDIFYRSGRPK